MAQYFQLYPRVPRYGVDTHEPAVLQHVDLEIAMHMHCDCHPKYWAYGWYDLIGFWLACGVSHNDIDARLSCVENDGQSCWHYAPALREINRFIQERYSVNSWAGR